MPDEFLTKTDFSRFEDRLWSRFDRSDDITRQLGERVAVVETKANENEARLDSHSTDTKKTASGWGATVGAAAAAFVYSLFSIWHGNK